MARFSRTISVDVEVEVDYVLSEATDTELADELKSRKKTGKNGDDVRENVSHAINQIRLGKLDDAIITLERAFLPRWKDVADCEQQYKLAMGRA